MPQREVPHSNAQRSKNSPEDEAVIDVSQCNREIVPIIRSIESRSLDDGLIAPACRQCKSLCERYQSLLFLLDCLLE